MEEAVDEEMEKQQQKLQAQRNYELANLHDTRYGCTIPAVECHICELTIGEESIGCDCIECGKQIHVACCAEYVVGKNKMEMICLDCIEDDAISPKDNTAPDAVPFVEGMETYRERIAVEALKALEIVWQKRDPSLVMLDPPDMIDLTNDGSHLPSFLLSDKFTPHQKQRGWEQVIVLQSYYFEISG
jgi:hypothetical protein